MVKRLNLSTFCCIFIAAVYFSDSLLHCSTTNTYRPWSPPKTAVIDVEQFPVPATKLDWVNVVSDSSALFTSSQNVFLHNDLVNVFDYFLTSFSMHLTDNAAFESWLVDIEYRWFLKHLLFERSRNSYRHLVDVVTKNSDLLDFINSFRFFINSVPSSSLNHSFVQYYCTNFFLTPDAAWLWRSMSWSVPTLSNEVVMRLVSMLCSTNKLEFYSFLYGSCNTNIAIWYIYYFNSSAKLTLTLPDFFLAMFDQTVARFIFLKLATV